MHYCPESCREFLDETPISGSPDEAGRGFHYRSAPVYLLTAVVGLLLGGDVAIGVLEDAGVSAWSEYRSIAGYRLALLAAVLGGARILYRTLEGLFEGKVGADLALTIAALAAIVLGEHSTAALVVFIALCGESIEGYTVDRAQQAIRGVFNLCPPTARVLTDGGEQEIPVDDVQTGQTVLVRPGERLPVDGVVRQGTSAVDQSALTGESLPVEKEVDDEVFAGTLNRFGALEIETTRTGTDSTLGRVVELVAEASERKAPLERTADRYARLFLPVVLGTALCTLIGWRIGVGEWRPGFLPALSVLVVACPCPLILATPSAVMAAMAWLARSGVVVKGSAALERLAQVDTFAFDKTGTLTQGELQLGTVLTFGLVDETELIRTAAIAERRSEHPIARVVCREAEARGCVIPGVYDFEARAGAGVVAQVPLHDLGDWASGIRAGNDGRARLVVGNRRLIDQQKIHETDQTAAAIETLDARGESLLIVAGGDAVLGVIGVRDTIRESAADVLSQLKAAGIGSFVMLTGDRRPAAQQVANSLPGLESFTAELLPADKADWIENATSGGQRVAMVGDGVNDAPALATSTVGIALGGVGSDLAAEAGDLILMGDPLRPLPGLLRLSRRLVQTIRESIYLFAFGMNGVGMVLGASAILSPAAAAIFHEVASLAVMINALRLLWFERTSESRLHRAGQSLAAGLEWCVQSLSPQRLVFRFLDHAGLILRLSFAVLALAWFLSGLTLIEPGSQALVTRFGRFQSVLDAGLHWRWPAPFENVLVERVDEFRSLPIGFRLDPSSASDPSSARDPSAGKEQPVRGPIEWTSDHSEHAFEPVSDEAVTLTADEVPVELTAEINYQISDLRRFVFSCSDPVETLRAVAESSVREVVSRTALEDVMTGARPEIEQQVAEAIASAAKTYELGIDVRGVRLLDVHPPRQVVASYRQVADAEELREQLINEAEAYYARTVLSAAGESAIRLLNSSVEGNSRQSGSSTGAVTAWSLDDELWAQLIRANAGHPMALSGEAASKLHRAREERTRRVTSAEGSVARISSLVDVHRLHPELTARSLYFSAVSEALSGKPLTILDPQVTGRKHMLLLDPDEFAAPGFLQPMLDSSGNQHETAE